MYSIETEGGDQLTAAARALRDAQADHDAARTPTGRAITLLRLRAAREWLAQVSAEVERSADAADAPPRPARRAPFTPAVGCWQGTALTFCDDEDGPLVSRAPSGALTVGNPGDAR